MCSRFFLFEIHRSRSTPNHKPSHISEFDVLRGSKMLESFVPSKDIPCPDLLEFIRNDGFQDSFWFEMACSWPMG